MSTVARLDMVITTPPITMLTIVAVTMTPSPIAPARRQRLALERLEPAFHRLEARHDATSLA
jgi:hypothetical protein